MIDERKDIDRELELISWTSAPNDASSVSSVRSVVSKSDTSSPHSHVARIGKSSVYALIHMTAPAIDGLSHRRTIVITVRNGVRFHHRDRLHRRGR